MYMVLATTHLKAAAEPDIRSASAAD